jgi:cell division protein FtsX
MVAHLAPSRLHAVIKRNTNGVVVVIFFSLVVILVVVIFIALVIVIVVVIVLVNSSRPETTDNVVVFVQLQNGLKHVCQVERHVAEKAQIPVPVYQLLHLAVL